MLEKEQKVGTRLINMEIGEHLVVPLETIEFYPSNPSLRRQSCFTYLETTTYTTVDREKQ